MNTPKYFQIPITTPLAEFKNHLEDTENHRIFFNGKFGTGKTYFLNQFFNDANDYKAIHLYPVNYQVSSNEDIFELIKYDILLELVGRGWFEGKDELTKSLAVQSYILSEGGKTALKLLKCIPKIGKVVKAGEYLTKFITGFQEYESELNKGELDYITEYVNDLHNKTGSAIEYDRISQIIRTVIETKGNEKLCLIIDDLDRIDPEHIFRILNVFSAHFDLLKDHENKFGFAKIIVVGDIDNIRNIFKAKYGMDADFNGYVDKFYSKAVFNFDNSATIIKKISQIIQSYTTRTYMNNTRYRGIINEDIKYILYIMILAGTLNYRDLERLFKNNYNWDRVYNVIETNYHAPNLASFDASYIVDFLFFIFECDRVKFKEAMNKSMLQCIEDNSNERLMAQLLLFANYKNLIFNEGENQTKFLDEESGLALNVIRNPWGLRHYYYQANFDNNAFGFSNRRLFKLLLEIHNDVYSSQQKTKFY